MPWFFLHGVANLSMSFVCLLFISTLAVSMKGENKKEDQVPVLATAELPAKSVDLAALNLTELVNGMLNTALKETKKYFSLLSITSYSSYAFHKVSIVVYNISNLKNIDPTKFPTRYCYCLNNRTNDLTDFTALLVDIIGNSTSYLKEIFKSTSILSVSQSNDTECVYICVMSGRTGRNLSDLWEAVEKSPVINYTFSGNTSGLLNLNPILPSQIPSRDNIDKVLGGTAEDTWTFKTTKLPTWAQTGALKGKEMLLSHLPILSKTLSLKDSKVPSVQVPFRLQTDVTKVQDDSSTKIASARPSFTPGESHDMPLGTPPASTPKMSTQAWTIAVKSDAIILPEFTTGRKTTGWKGSEVSPFQVPSWLQTNMLQKWETAITKTKPSPASGVPPQTQPVPTTGIPSPLPSPSTEQGEDAVKTLPPFIASSTFFVQPPSKITKPPPQMHTGKRPLRPLSTPTPRPDILLKVHSSRHGSETPAIPMDLPLETERDLNNITFFNGLFANAESVALFFDCLGSHFTWLQAIFTSFPALLNFVSKMKCVTGICPRDFEDYGCACRFELEGLPADEADSCCFEHRKCHEEAAEEDCTWDLAKLSVDISCLTKNITCDSEDPCERLLCNCDKAAIECFLHSHINSSLNSLDVSFCPSLVTERQQRTENTELTTTFVAEVIPQPTDDASVRTPDTQFSLDMKIDGGLQEADVQSESGDRLLSYAEVRGQDGIIAAFGDSTQGEFTENSLVAEGTASTPTEINSIEPGLMPTSDFAGRSTDIGNNFKLADGQDSHFSTVAPEETLDPEESFGEVCERFTFLQLRDNGRVKRELPQLGEMLYCLTDRCPEQFELYGCYCGQEGRGHPTDELDRCCFSHHCCLEQVKRLGCHPERNSKSEVVCFDRTPTCVGWTMCEKLICSCDKAAAECMAAASFNESLSFPNRQACQESQPFCRRGVHERPSSSGGIGASVSSSEEESSSEEAEPARDILNRRKRAARRAQGKFRIAPLQTR